MTLKCPFAGRRRKKYKYISENEWKITVSVRELTETSNYLQHLGVARCSAISVREQMMHGYCAYTKKFPELLNKHELMKNRVLESNVTPPPKKKKLFAPLGIVSV